jgi:glutamate racemase
VETVDRTGSIPVMGVIGPGAHEALATSRSGRIGVIGTESTIQQGAYQRVLKNLAPDVAVMAQACPLFVPLVEEGWLDNEVTHATAERYLTPLIRQDIDTLILGCTHYPLLRTVIQEKAGKRIRVVDPSLEAARQIAGYLKDIDIPVYQEESAGHRFFVSDLTRHTEKIASEFLGKRIKLEEAGPGS